VQVEKHIIDIWIELDNKQRGIERELYCDEGQDINNQAALLDKQSCKEKMGYYHDKMLLIEALLARMWILYRGRQ